MKRSGKILVRLLPLLILLTIASAGIFGVFLFPRPLRSELQVIDGDTLKLSREVLRLAGIDAPESYERCYQDAKSRLEELVKRCSSVEVVGRDKHGRPLVFLRVGEKSANLVLVEEGLAIALTDTPYAFLKDAEARAMREGKGCLWKPSASPCRGCIEVGNFRFDAKGDDCQNPEDEWVELVNACDFDCQLEKWELRDEEHHIYEFPAYVLRARSSVRIVTGCGGKAANTLYWCNCCRRCNAVWDNNGDTFYLWDSEGGFVLAYSYGGRDNF